MAYTIKVLDKAERELSKLPKKDSNRIVESIDKLALNPFPMGVKPVKGLKDHFRIRVGNYRLIYQVRQEVLVIVVVRIGHRREVYRKLKM